MITAPQHIVAGYDAELNRLTLALSNLGSVVEGMVSDAVSCLKTRDTRLAEEVVARDLVANRFQSEIDDDSMRILALRNPMVIDLRRTVGAMRVATDLERIGDLAEGIAKRSLFLATQPSFDAVDGLVRMGRQVKTHLSKALDALLREDAATAMQIWLADDDIDAHYNSVVRQLLTHMSGDPATVNGATALLFAAKNLERVGDHTSNICESIYFVSTGGQLIEDEGVQHLLKEAT